MEPSISIKLNINQIWPYLFLIRLIRSFQVLQLYSRSMYSSLNYNTNFAKECSETFSYTSLRHYFHCYLDFTKSNGKNQNINLYLNSFNIYYRDSSKRSFYDSCRYSVYHHKLLQKLDRKLPWFSRSLISSFIHIMKNLETFFRKKKEIFLWMFQMGSSSYSCNKL